MSTNLETLIFSKNGFSYLVIENEQDGEVWDWTDNARVYGTFSTPQAAEDYLVENFANTGWTPQRLSEDELPSNAARLMEKAINPQPSRTGYTRRMRGYGRW